MKHILKQVLATMVVVLGLILINMVFIQGFVGDLDWLNILLSTAYLLVVVAAAVYDGVTFGVNDCKYGHLLEKQKEKRGYELTQDDRQRMFHPRKGFITALIAGAPAILVSLAAILLGENAPLGLTVVTRVFLGQFLGWFLYVEDLLPWLYLPMALLYPVCQGVAYLFGPKLWAKKLVDMEKAKKEKLRKVNRKKRRKKVQNPEAK